MMYEYAYPRPAVTVDALVRGQRGGVDYLVLIRRKNPPFENQWALPGGFVDMDETLEEAVVRELKEETGLVCKHLRQFKSYSAIDRDSRGRTISVVFSACLTDTPEIAGGDDAREARWFPVTELPALAFDHQQIVDEFLTTNQA